VTKGSEGADRSDLVGGAEQSVPPSRVESASGAGSPTGYTWRDWLSVLKRVWSESSKDNVGLVAAGCGFYAMFALFPALTVLVSLYGLIADPAMVESQLEALEGMLPSAAYEMISTRVHDLATAPPTALGWGLLFGILIALWSATAGVKSLLTALNIAYEEEEKRGLIRYQLTAILFTLAALLAVTIALSTIVVVPAVLKFAWLGTFADIAVRAASFLVLLLFIMFGLAVLYRFGPSRSEARWRWVTPGSVMAALLLIAASMGFSFYVANFGSYDATYGSLGAVIVVLFWLYISSYVVIIGAELNAELELHTKADTTTGEIEPMGRRGAFVADHVVRAG
jgi:membrane protein